MAKLDSNSEQNEQPKTIVRVGSALVYPPQIESDGSLVYTGGRPPKETGWHESDRDNPMRLEVLDNCDHRQMTLTRRCCGNARVRMVCGCESCPIFGQTILPHDCMLCGHREETGKPIEVKVLLD